LNLVMFARRLKPQGKKIYYDKKNTEMIDI